MSESHNFPTTFGGTLPHRISRKSVVLFKGYMEKSIYGRMKTRLYIKQIWLKIGVDQQILVNYFPYRNSAEICPKPLAFLLGHERTDIYMTPRKGLFFVKNI
jgi:hypothetical protein